eukprot:3293590-Pyramimonas_sp.AAC.2
MFFVVPILWLIGMRHGGAVRKAAEMVVAGSMSASRPHGHPRATLHIHSAAGHRTSSLGAARRRRGRSPTVRRRHPQPRWSRSRAHALHGLRADGGGRRGQ